MGFLELIFSGPKWIEENFMVIQDPLNKYHRVGIAKEIAMKALSLGYFPDSASIDKMRNVGSEGASLQGH
jgi:hypothetical protein